MQRTANPFISVQFRYRPPKVKKRYFFSCKKNLKGVYLSVLFRCSSVVEQSAVNRSVVGSSPTAGAIKEAVFLRPLFIFPFSAAIFALSVFVFSPSLRDFSDLLQKLLKISNSSPIEKNSFISLIFKKSKADDLLFGILEKLLKTMFFPVP